MSEPRRELGKEKRRRLWITRCQMATPSDVFLGNTNVNGFSVDSENENENSKNLKSESKTNQKSWERDYQAEERAANEIKYKENAKQREHFDMVYKSFTKKRAPERPDQAFIVQNSALKYEGGSINDVRATPKPDRYNPQFLLDETYFQVWGDGYRQWFRSLAKTSNKRRRGDQQKSGEGGEKKKASERLKEKGIGKEGAKVQLQEPVEDGEAVEEEDEDGGENDN